MSSAALPVTDQSATKRPAKKQDQTPIDPLMPATVNRELACLKNMLNKAIKWRHANENPVKGVEFFKEERPDVVILSPEKEVELLDKLASKKTRAVVVTALNAGMRKKEIFGPH